jgi:hypothetical protein
MTSLTLTKLKDQNRAPNQAVAQHRNSPRFVKVHPTSWCSRVIHSRTTNLAHKTSSLILPTRESTIPQSVLGRATTPARLSEPYQPHRRVRGTRAKLGSSSQYSKEYLNINPLSISYRGKESSVPSVENIARVEAVSQIPFRRCMSNRLGISGGRGFQLGAALSPGNYYMGLDS